MKSRNNVPSQSLSEHLRRLHQFTQNAEEKLRTALSRTEQMGIEAEGVSDRIDEAHGADLDEETVACIVDLLITIRLVVIGNEELQRKFEASIANKVANAITLAEAWQLLTQIDYILIAAEISQVRDREIMKAAVGEIVRRGGDGAQRLDWLAEALKREGY